MNAAEDANAAVERDTVARLEDFLHGDLDDEAGLQFAEKVRASAEQAGMVADFLVQHELLAEFFRQERPGDSERFVAAVVASLDNRLREDSNQATDRIMARIGRSARPGDANRDRQGPWSRLRVALAAAASLAAVVGLWWAWQGARGGPAGLRSVVATAGTVTGEVQVRGADGTMRGFGAGARIGPGDRVLTGPNGEAILSWKDGTRTTVRGNSDFGLALADCRLANGEYRKALDLARGGIAASIAKQPAGRRVTIATPNGTCTAVGTKFFVMAAGGVTAQKVPWSFTRLDVTEGTVEFQASPDIRRAIPVSAGQAVCAGRDADGREIATKPFASDGREMSPEYGGVFYLNVAKFYAERRAWLLDAGGVRTGAVWRTISPAECARIGRASGGVAAFLKTDEQDGAKTETLRLTHRDAKGAGQFSIPLPPMARESFFAEWMLTGRVQRLVGRSRLQDSFLRWDVAQDEFDAEKFDPGPELRPPVPAPRMDARVAKSTIAPTARRTEMLRVGSAVDGTPLWESRCHYLDRQIGERWQKLRPPGVFRIVVANKEIDVKSVTIGELSLSAGDAGPR